MMRRFLLMLILGGFGLITSAQDTLPLYDLPDSFTYPAFSSNSLVALSGGRVATVNPLSDSVAIVDVRGNSLLAEIPVGDDPRSIDVTPDATRLLVTNHGDDTFSIIDVESSAVIANYSVGHAPYGVITNNNETAFLTLQGEPSVIEIELATGDILQEIQTPDDPTGLAIWADFLYVTHFHSGQISLIYLPVGDVVRTISTGQNTGLSQFIYLDGRNGLAYVPQSVTYPDNLNPTFDRMIRPRVIMIDLEQLRVIQERTIWLDIADQPVNMPFSVALNLAQGRLFVVNAGSNNLSVIDLASGFAQWHTTLMDNPRGIVLAGDSSAIYINNVVDSSLSILETRFYSVEDSIPTITTGLPLQTQVGAPLFFSSTDPRVSISPYLSCASCHFDGSSDGRVWQGRLTPELDSLSGLTVGLLNAHIQSVTQGTGFADSSLFDAEAMITFMQSLAD